MNTEDYDKIATLANLETIRSARIEPLQLQTTGKDFTGVTDLLKLPKLRPGRIHVITAISFLGSGPGKPQVFLSLLSKGEEFNIYSFKMTVSGNSVTWAGQIIGLEYDEICARLTGMGLTDTGTLTAFGYSMRF